MKMILRCIVIVFGIISLSEGKGCPQHSKPHQTRCDMYFKCALLPSKNHVWVPTKCDDGLIYEPSLKMCVLAGDDWECTLGDKNGSTASGDENNVYGVNNLDYMDDSLPQVSDSNKQTSMESVWIEPNGNGYAPSGPPNSASNKNDDTDSDEKIIVVGSDSDENGNDIEISDGYEMVPLVDNKKGDEKKPDIIVGEASDEIESSGDGSVSDSVEKKENYLAIPIDAIGKGSMTPHLQRLTQLIQSLSDSQHNKSQSYELGPNELNNFLTNHNIQTDYKTHTFTNVNKHPVPDNGKIHPDHLMEILELQQKLQDLSNIVDGMSTQTPITTFQTTTTGPFSLMASTYGTTSTTPSPVSVDKYPELTKIHIKNQSPGKYGQLDSGYSSSQIVVNRPEGSVLFSVPSNPGPASYKKDEIKSEPYISEDTLRTMLELSKQMISNQNGVHKDYVPEQNYLQPIFRPIYYNIPIHELPIPVLSNYRDSSNQDKRNRKPKPATKKEPIVELSIDDLQDSALSKYDESDDYLSDKKGEEHATIIHNHIPITIENARNKQKPATPSNRQEQSSQITPNDGSYNTITSKPANNYNNNIPISPSNNYQTSDNYQSYRVKPNGNYNNYGPNQNYNTNYGIYPSNGNGNLYYSQQNSNPKVPDVQQTTAYPFYAQQQQQIPASSYNIYPNNQYYQNSQYQPGIQSSGQTVPNYYTQSPHLNEQNVNNFLNFNTPSYPTIKPTQSQYITSNPSGTYQTQVNSPGLPAPFNENSNKDRNEDITEVDEDPTDMNDSSENARETDINSSSEMQDAVMPSLKTQLFPDDLESNLFGDNRKRVVSFAGNFMSYDTFEKSIAPLLHNNAAIANEVEVITCVTGARQPNKTDCTRYFVCNSKTGSVLPYLCPPYTAFNSQTRFCDAKTYATCNPTHIEAQITIDANRRIQLKAQEALNEANRVRDEALKTQRLATLIKLQTQNLISEPIPVKQQQQQISVTHRPLIVYRVTRKPVVTMGAVAPASNGVGIKARPRIRKVACREPGKIADQLSRYNYFLCYKDVDNMLRARKMTCPGALVFCKSIRLCTQLSRCPVN